MQADNEHTVIFDSEEQMLEYLSYEHWSKLYNRLGGSTCRWEKTC